MADTIRDSAPTLRLAAALDGWSGWGLPLTGRPQLLHIVDGGRTNWNFRIAAPGLAGDLLLRLNHPDSVALGIDRTLERDILAVTADAGISRPFCHWDAADRFVVFPWLEARTWTKTDFASTHQRARLQSLIGRVHRIELDRPRRDYQAYLHHYLRQLKLAGPIEPALERRWAQFEPRLQAFAKAPWPARLVHHDLIPDNVLETNRRLYLIDWEYAAAGHPDIDTWSVDPETISDPFIAELMGWINDLWERLVAAPLNRKEPDSAL